MATPEDDRRSTLPYVQYKDDLELQSALTLREALHLECYRIYTEAGSFAGGVDLSVTADSSPSSQKSSVADNCRGFLQRSCCCALCNSKVGKQSDSQQSTTEKSMGSRIMDSMVPRRPLCDKAVRKVASPTLYIVYLMSRLMITSNLLAAVFSDLTVYARFVLSVVVWVTSIVSAVQGSDPVVTAMLAISSVALLLSAVDLADKVLTCQSCRTSVDSFRGRIPAILGHSLIVRLNWCCSVRWRVIGYASLQLISDILHYPLLVATMCNLIGAIHQNRSLSLPLVSFISAAVVQFLIHINLVVASFSMLWSAHTIHDCFMSLVKHKAVMTILLPLHVSGCVILQLLMTACIGLLYSNLFEEEGSIPALGNLWYVLLIAMFEPYLGVLSFTAAHFYWVVQFIVEYALAILTQLDSHKHLTVSGQVVKHDLEQSSVTVNSVVLHKRVCLPLVTPPLGIICALYYCSLAVSAGLALQIIPGDSSWVLYLTISLVHIVNAYPFVVGVVWALLSCLLLLAAVFYFVCCCSSEAKN